MRRVTIGRTSAVVVAVGLVAAALTGCSSNPNADCGTALPSGSASKLVEATGKIGEKPKITVPTPLDTTKSQRSILTDGTGEQVHQGQVVEIQYTILDGKTGEVQQTSYGSGDTYPLALGAGNEALSKGLQCAPVGSRVAVVISPLSPAIEPTWPITRSILASRTSSRIALTECGAPRKSSRRWTSVMRLATGCRFSVQSSALSPPPTIITFLSRKSSMRRTA